MSFRKSLLCCTCIVAATLGAAPSHSQDVGGFIGLMGKMIEQDMRNQQERRRLDAEQQRYREQQQAIRREEQARLDEERRQEILLVRRLQTALSKLGFYNSKIDGDRGPGTQKSEMAFMRAFEVSDIELNEYNVSELERLAERGFRSVDELRTAARAGFDNRDDYIAARDGGFETAQDYAVASEAGFSRFEDYRQFRVSGFSTAADYRVAVKGGFILRTEFDAARAAGFASRPDYLAFQKSGLSDKASFDKAQAAQKFASEAAGTCEKALADADISKPVDVCLNALVAGADTSRMKSNLERLRARVREELDGLSKQSAAEQVEVASTDGVEQSKPTGAADFMVRQAKLQNVANQIECGVGVSSGGWKAASENCGTPLQEVSSPAVAKLHQLAVAQLKVEQDAAAREEEKKQAAARAEQARLALNAAHDRVAALLSDVADFTEAKRSLAKPLDVAKAVVRLKQVGVTDDFAAIEQALLSADELLNNEPDFQKFLSEKKRAGEIAQVNARTTAVAELRRVSVFIESFVGKNLLHEAVNDLLQLQEQIASAQKSGQDEQIFNMQKAAQVEVGRLKLSAELANFVYEENAPAKSDVQAASNGIAVTDGNRELLEGHRNDVLVLGNFTAQAPHLIVDLLGKPTFDGGSVVYCWTGNDSKPPLFDLILPSLRSMGASTFQVNDKCSPNTAMTSDILVIERGAFLSQDVLEARPVIEAFEAGKLKTIKTILWSEAGQSAEDDKRLAASIRDEVVGKARVGFGILRFDTGSQALCIVVPPNEEEFHRRALMVRANDTERFLPGDVSVTGVSLEKAFAGIQKHLCKAVYASETDLASLIAGLQKISMPYDVVPVWFDRELVEEGRSLALRSEEEKQREVAAKRQELEAEAALNQKKSEEEAVVRERHQAELRQRYSQESRAAYNELSELVKAYVNEGSSQRTELAAMFPALRQWKAQQDEDGWVPDHFDDELVDYGTADWQGRRLEAVVIKASVTTKNPVLGKYENACFLLGYLIDSEFGMRRDPILETCDEGGARVADWHLSRRFESRWVASR